MISKQDLESRNPWWAQSEYKILENDLPKRDLYDLLLDNFSHTLILNIVGLRRVGKSTLLKQLIGKFLNDGENPKNVFYYLFDYATQPQKAEFLDEVLSVYFQEVLKKPNYSSEEKVYVFLDEIQYIENWQAVLKRYYDLSNQQIKFIVTGSQSVLLKGKYRESLAGRVFDFYLPPLSFREFVKINREEVKLFDKFDLYSLDKIFGDLSGYNTFFSQKIIGLVQEYITVGQFPETRKLNSVDQKHDYILGSVVGKVLEDCVRVFNIDKVEEFKLINGQLLDNVSSVFELKNLGREVGVSFLTIDKYLGFLKESYLFEILYKYHKSLIKRGRILKKIYTPCVNFVCAKNHFGSEQVEKMPQVFGKIIENVVYNVLSLKYAKDSDLNNSISFWRQGQKEIDFIIIENGKLLPVEVKFSENFNDKDLAVLIDYLKNKKLAYGVVVTRNELAKREISGQLLYFIPYYLVLMVI